MKLKGIHHLSAYTANAQENYTFYTEVLGMRLIKKTVNQDTPTMYHLFYGDEVGNPGTELTFFEIPNAGSTYRGTNSISSTSLRVPSDEALNYWKKRFDTFGVTYRDITERAGHQVLPFEDPEGQRLALISDEKNVGVKAGVPWGKSPVPAEFGIIGLGPIQLTVANWKKTAHMLTDIMGYKQTRKYPSEVADQPDILVFETGDGGSGSEIHVEERSDLPVARPGRGSVHHVAFRVEDDEELQRSISILQDARIGSSGFVDRYYFSSTYFKEPNGIVFELATDGPGFTIDEHIDHLGENLALPPFLESQRKEIEAKLTPIVT